MKYFFALYEKAQYICMCSQIVIFARILERYKTEIMLRFIICNIVLINIRLYINFWNSVCDV